MKHDLEKKGKPEINIISVRELSGLKINFDKSELFGFREAQEDANLYVELFGCGLGSFPISYMGIPIHHRRLALAEWKHVEERLQKRLGSWKGKLLSLGERLVLINLVLTNMVFYMICFFQLRKEVTYQNGRDCRDMVALSM
jgi:hypothetical protein